MYGTVTPSRSDRPTTPLAGLAGSSVRRCSTSTSSPPVSDGTGSTLYVKGMSDERVRGSGCTSAFRSSTTFGDAHLQELKHMTPLGYSPLPNLMTPRKSPSESRRGSAAFAAKTDDRYSYLAGAARSSTPGRTSTEMYHRLRAEYEEIRSPTSKVEGTRSQRPPSPSASFRSKTPIACAHISSVPRMHDPVTVGVSSDDTPARCGSANRLRPTSSFRSSADRDSYIKALPATSERFLTTRSDFDLASSPSGTRPRISSGGTAAFKSKTSIADAHIKVMVKPVDTCVAFSS